MRPDSAQRSTWMLLVVAVAVLWTKASDAGPPYQLSELYLEDLFRIYAQSPEPLQRGPFADQPGRYDPAEFGHPDVRDLRRAIARKLNQKRDQQAAGNLQWYLRFLDGLDTGNNDRRKQLQREVRKRLTAVGVSGDPAPPDAPAGGSEPVGDEAGIDRLWVFLFGPSFVQARDDPDALTEYFSRLRRLGVTDVVYSINRLDKRGVSPASDYDGYRRESTAFQRARRVTDIAGRYRLAAHLMLFLRADPDFVRAWAPAIQRLTDELTVRSLLLDVEGGTQGWHWWVHQPRSLRQRAAHAVRDEILARWNRPQLGLGVTSLAVGTGIGELMELADYGLPQMYLSPAWSRSPATVQAHVQTSYRRYAAGGSRDTHDPPRPVVVGLTARRDVLGPQAPPARTCIGLESVLALDGEDEQGATTVREIAVWDSDKLLSAENTDLRQLFGRVGKAIHESGRFGYASLSAACP